MHLKTVTARGNDISMRITEPRLVSAKFKDYLKLVTNLVLGTVWFTYPNPFYKTQSKKSFGTKIVPAPFHVAC